MPFHEYSGRYRQNQPGREIEKKLTYRNIRIINKVSGLLFLAFGVALLIGVMVTMVKTIVRQ